MIRIAGVDILENKKVGISLTKIYGIGRSNAKKLCDLAKVDVEKRISQLTLEEVKRIQNILDSSFKVEGDLRREVRENIQRLKAINSYRGLRHKQNLPVRGQRTRSNARTKRGKRVTIGAMRRDVRAKLGVTRDIKKEKTT